LSLGAKNLRRLFSRLEKIMQKRLRFLIFLYNGPHIICQVQTENTKHVYIRSLYTENKIWSVKNLEKKIHIYIFIFYMLIHNFINTYIFVGYVKRTKNASRKVWFQYQILSFLHWLHIKLIFLKPLRGHVGHEDVHTIFLFNFFIL
jgi:hypothetical protein